MDRVNENNHVQLTLLEEKIQTFEVDQTLVIADMTKTLLFQEEDGLRPNILDGLIPLLKHHMSLVVVTSDSIQTVREHMLSDLAQAGSQNVYILCASGFDIYHFDGTNIKKLFTGTPLLEEQRAKILSALEIHVRKVDPAYRLTDAQKDMLLSEEGGKDFLHIRSEKNLDFIFEMRAGKYSIFLPDTTPENVGFMNSFSEDPEIVSIQEKTGFHAVLDYDYFEMTSVNKRQGLEVFTKLIEEQLQEVLSNILVLGDSKNDIGLFQFPFPDLLVDHAIEKLDRIIKIFVGPDEATYELAKTDQDRHFLFLQAMLVDGTAEVLKRLSHNIRSAQREAGEAGESVVTRREGGASASLTHDKLAVSRSAGEKEVCCLK